MRSLIFVFSFSNLGGGGGGCTQFVYGRIRMTIDLRIPTMLGRDTSGFQQPGIFLKGRGSSITMALVRPPSPVPFMPFPYLRLPHI